METSLIGGSDLLFHLIGKIRVLKVLVLGDQYWLRQRVVNWVLSIALCLCMLSQSFARMTTALLGSFSLLKTELVFSIEVILIMLQSIFGSLIQITTGQRCSFGAIHIIVGAFLSSFKGALCFQILLFWISVFLRFLSGFILIDPHRIYFCYAFKMVFWWVPHRNRISLLHLWWGQQRILLLERH